MRNYVRDVHCAISRLLALRKNFPRRVSLAVLLAASVGLAACEEHMGVQVNYTKIRNACQDGAEQKVAKESQARAKPMEAKEKNARLVKEFNNCMLANDWDLGKPRDVAGGGGSGGGAGGAVPVPVAGLPGSGSPTAGIIDSAAIKRPDAPIAAAPPVSGIPAPGTAVPGMPNAPAAAGVPVPADKVVPNAPANFQPVPAVPGVVPGGAQAPKALMPGRVVGPIGPGDRAPSVVYQNPAGGVKPAEATRSLPPNAAAQNITSPNAAAQSGSAPIVPAPAAPAPAVPAEAAAPGLSEAVSGGNVVAPTAPVAAPITAPTAVPAASAPAVVPAAPVAEAPIPESPSAPSMLQVPPAGMPPAPPANGQATAAPVAPVQTSTPPPPPRENGELNAAERQRILELLKEEKER